MVKGWNSRQHNIVWIYWKVTFNPFKTSHRDKSLNISSLGEEDCTLVPARMRHPSVVLPHQVKQITSVTWPYTAHDPNTEQRVSGQYTVRTACACAIHFLNKVVYSKRYPGCTGNTIRMSSGYMIAMTYAFCKWGGGGDDKSGCWQIGMSAQAWVCGSERQSRGSTEAAVWSHWLTGQALPWRTEEDESHLLKRPTKSPFAA